ncbi:MAG TPA: lycopene cyclase family protein [Flavobacterium sp.]|nr:lycopene cyclase family protein [Flavobacterium sp.]
MKHYDYIFTGAGLSALMTVYRMVESGKFEDQTILLLDKNPKKTNDRTWCFWEKGHGHWGQIVSKVWHVALFADENSKRELDLQPYCYKMIHGIDFYNFVFDKISKHPNISFQNLEITSFSESDGCVEVRAETKIFSCGKLFNSIFNPYKLKSQGKYPLLQQHFIGWKIKADDNAFNPEIATLMDFSVEQQGNTRFMYVLPTSKNEALIEYTLFSKNLLSETEYEEAIADYIQKFGITNYQIIEKERGSIPMTTFPFWESNTKNILNIGSAGGWTKASTGYTFKNADKESKRLVEFLHTEEDFRHFHKNNRFNFYDALLLDILNEKNEAGSEIFSALFQKGNPALIFKFLDEETTFFEDLQVILKCPKRLFIKVLFKRR